MKRPRVLTATEEERSGDIYKTEGHGNIPSEVTEETKKSVTDNSIREIHRFMMAGLVKCRVFKQNTNFSEPHMDLDELLP